MTQAQGQKSEEFRISGEAVLAKIKELVREGNVRRITIKNDEGRTLIEIPLTVGVIGTVLLPVWAAIGSIAALVANLTISVERHTPPVAPEPPAPPAILADDITPPRKEGDGS
jgi:DNA-binding Lrp family transcriptional regulator